MNSSNLILNDKILLFMDPHQRRIIIMDLNGDETYCLTGAIVLPVLLNGLNLKSDVISTVRLIHAELPDYSEASIQASIEKLIALFTGCNFYSLNKHNTKTSAPEFYSCEHFALTRLEFSQEIGVAAQVGEGYPCPSPGMRACSTFGTSEVFECYNFNGQPGGWVGTGITDFDMCGSY